MNSNIIITSPEFQREAKRLNKKFPKLKDELVKVFSALRKDAKHGESIGGSLYKIRLPNPDKGVGKSGGFRIITASIHYHEPEQHYRIYLIDVYDKTEVENIPTKDLIASAKAIIGDDQPKPKATPKAKPKAKPKKKK